VLESRRVLVGVGKFENGSERWRRLRIEVTDGYTVLDFLIVCRWLTLVDVLTDQLTLVDVLTDRLTFIDVY
jgi:hypothetical protein